MKQIIKKLRKSFTTPFVMFSTEKIPAELANKKLKEHFFKISKGSGNTHKVVDGCPVYYNDELKKWRVSSLALIWGHENQFIDVVKLKPNEVPNQVKVADIDWSI